MRLIKMLGLAAVAAIAAMAFLGASSAMATFNTTLCTEESESLTCPAGKLVELFDMLAGTTVLKTSLLTVLCLHSKVKVENETPGLLAEAPLPLHLKVEGGLKEGLTWENCGSNEKHDNCTVENVKLPLFDVLKTGQDLGTAVALGAEVHVSCSGLNCVYGGAEVKGFSVESAEHTAGAESGMFTANELVVPKVSGFLCPKESFWTALYKPMHLNEKGELLPLPLWLRT